MLCTGHRLAALIFYVYSETSYTKHCGCRYTVTADLGQAHLVLGKLTKSNGLTDAEATAVREIFPSAKLEDYVVYSRVLISGVLYTSTSYKRHTATNDHTLCLKQRLQKLFGSALKYLSFCTHNCTACSIFCTHVVIVHSHSILPCVISTDTITRATAQHIHCICSQPRLVI